MSWNNKVIWSEGMLLQPQHLQQHDRYLRAQIDARCAALRPYAYGFSELAIDMEQLKLGRIALTACAGVLPDGSPFRLPADDDLPLPLAVPEDARDLTVVLALPVARRGVPEASHGAQTEGAGGPDGFTRHRIAETEVLDSNDGAVGAALVQVGKLQLRLAFERDVAHAHTSLGIARIVERRADNSLVIDAAYAPPCLDYRVSRRLCGFVDELVGLMHQRADALAARLAQPAATGAAEIADFLLLQVLNRAEPLFAGIASTTGLHPHDLHQHALQLAGELATFSQPGKRPAGFPVYRHERLDETFTPLVDALRGALSAVMDPHAVPIALEERKYGLRVAIVPDRELFASASFVLAVKADLAPAALLNGFPQQVKLGPVERIRDLVNLQLPGIALRALPVAPRQLPFHAGFTYFELERGGELWRQFATSAGVALHVAGDFPGIELEFWAIRP
ncbi:type VI secretion system baseplate subunit TssK [Paraburkholderia sp. MMS20-SJTN17]|uniref:Type VI secretion system baseplate subunit TssK n=1 Tax=Paraburkholderia translucens TaxID=2886945 RepID=A0ABS8KES3_9BURK|nr:type VI secretion system baseplate subunit TssK [Paraburkholderia sp. MMS20-SJTN17]MCC8402944.1 type VI secretion system baseplate subunit TssK [Paraburkholderia sp. MMS20-SJTN17]